jgi:lipopolysaccharide transport system permease protein/teichoic acid transport system permease protein
MALLPKHLFYFKDNINLSINVKNKTDIEYQLFYTHKDGSQEFNEHDSIKKIIKGKDEFQSVNFELPVDNIISFRIDFGIKPEEILLKSIDIKKNNTEKIYSPFEILKGFNLNEIQTFEEKEDAVIIKSDTNDPHIFLKNPISIEVAQNKRINYVVLICTIVFVLISTYYIVGQAQKRGLYSFIENIYQARKLIYELAKKDLKTRYMGSYLGIIWAFVQPICTIMILWFVFQVGLRAAPIDNFPFILWLICGMIPWFYISENIQSSASSIVDNSYLVKKVVFRVSALPIIRITSGLFVHLFFVCIMIIMFASYGYLPTAYTLQILYYLLCTVMLVLSLSWLTSSLFVFVKDLGQIIAILVQFGFWLTPIFWTLDRIPEKFKFIFKANPVYYIIEGYRDSLINNVWFWERPILTIDFWVITGVLFVAGALIFKRLRPHFADVL